MSVKDLPCPSRGGVFIREVLLRVTSFAKTVIRECGGWAIKCGNAILCPQWRGTAVAACMYANCLFGG